MSLPAALFLLAVLLSLSVMGVLGAALYTQGKELYHSAMAFQKQIAPTVADITAGGTEAQAAAARVQERLEALQEATASLRRFR